MNLLLIGASSFIGREIYRYSKKQNIKIIGTATDPKCSEWFKFNLKNDRINDIIDKSGLSEDIENTCAIVTAFYCGHERTVINLSEAELINLTGTQKLMADLHRSHIKTLWLSTEQVFSGRDGNAPYKETDVTSPVLAYGRHKAEMECYIRENMPEVIIYRLSQNIAPYVEGIHIFNDVYIRYQKGERHFQSIKGQIISPTDVRDTAKWIVEGIKRRLPGGIYHFANPKSMLRSELVSKFLQAISNDADVTEVPMESFGFKEPRPLDTRLDIRKIMLAMPDIQFTSVDTVINSFMSNIVMKGDK